MNRSVVLDASAVLALLHNELGGSKVAEYIQFGAALSTVNLTEIISKQQELGIPTEEMMDMLELMGIDIHFFDQETAVYAGIMRISTKSLGLSLGDRACLALAQKLKLPVLTADRAWTQLNNGIEIILIR